MTSVSSASGPAANRPMVALVTGLSTLMVMLDITVVNVALPHIEGGLNATREQVTWTLTAYVIAMALTTPLVGWLAERIGKRALFVASMAGFTAASVACGLAASTPELVGFRILQGVFAASVAPLSQAILLDVTPRERHGRAMALWAMATMLGPTLGPPLGGWLADQESWRWCFLINLPLGAAAVFGAWIFIRDGAKPAPRGLDLGGYLALALGVAGLQLLLDRGPGKDWFAAQETWIWAGMAILGFYWFTAQSLTAARPLFSPELARDPNFVCAAGLALVICLVLFSSVTLVPPILQGILGYSAFDSGVTLLPRGAATIVSTLLVGRIVGRVDPRLIILVGLGLTAAGLWAMAGLSPLADNRAVMLASMVIGLGQGTFFVPASTIAFATLAPALRTEGAAALGLIRSLGTSMGVSLVAMLHNAQAFAARDVLGAQVSEEVLAERGTTALADLARAARELARQADMIAYNQTFALMAALCVLAAPLLLPLRIRPSPGARP